MKKLITSAACFCLLLFLNSCEDSSRIRVVPSGQLSTVDHSLPVFNGLEIGTAFRVELSIGELENPVTIVADDNLHDYIIVENSSGILKIRLRDDVSIQGTATLRAEISAASITSISGSGGSLIDVFGILNNESLNIRLSGASMIGGELDSEILNLYLSGASTCIFTGSANMVSLEASGASIAEDFELAVNRLAADLSGASITRLTIKERIDITASGGSFLYYRGEAVLNSSNLSGGSLVIRDNG